MVGLLAGCDSVGELSPEEGQPAHMLQSAPSGAEASAADRERQDPVRLNPGSFTQADLLFEPVSVSPGHPFSIELVDRQQGRKRARIVHKQTANGRQRLTAYFNSVDLDTVIVRFRNGDRVVKQTPRWIGAEGRGLQIGNSDEEPTSWHYIEDGDDIIVEVDYEDAPSPELRRATIDLAGSAQSVTCTHVAFVLRGAASEVDPSGVLMKGAPNVTFVKKRFE